VVDIKVWHLPEFDRIELLKGQRVTHRHPKHWHEEYHLCLIEQGTGQMFYRGAFHETYAGSLFIVHPGEIHSNAANPTSGCSFRTLNVSPHIFERAILYATGRRQELPFFPTAIVCDKDMLALYRSIHASFEESASRLERETLLLQLLIKLTSRYAEARPDLSHFEKEPSAVKRVKDYLEANYALNISLEDLAQLTNLSPFHLNRVFSKTLGLPPHAFQTQVRITKARKLLAQGRPISEVTYETGFADQSHLTRQFKRMFGITPSHFRLIQ
jgi:AraC-like DNA-binding protein